MFFSLPRNLLMFAIGGAAIIINLYIWHKRSRDYKRPAQLKAENEINQYYYDRFKLGADNFKCVNCVSAKKSCSYKCSYELLERICRDLALAHRRISLCMRIVSLDNVQDALVSAFKRGVNVRIVTNYNMTVSKNSNFEELINRGLDVRHNPNIGSSPNYENFCLIDEHDERYRRAFFGSLNLTTLGIYGSTEQVTFTNNSQCISKLSSEFKRLWRQGRTTYAL